MTTVTSHLAHSNAAIAPPPDRGVTRAMDSLDRAIDNHFVVFNELEDRLKSVLSAPVPMPTTGKNEIDNALCPLHERMQSADVQLANMTVRLRALLDRLQL